TQFLAVGPATDTSRRGRSGRAWPAPGRAWPAPATTRRERARRAPFGAGTALPVRRSAGARAPAPILRAMQELRAVWRFTLSLARALGWRFGVLLAVGLVASLTAGVGLLVMVPLLALVGVDAGGGATQALVERFGAALQGLGLPLSAPVLLALNALVLVATAAVGRYQSVLEARALEEYVMERRVRLFEAITHAEWRRVLGSRASNNAHLLTSEADRVASAGAAVIGLVTKGLLALAHLAVALVLAPLLTLLVMAAGLALAGATAPLTWRARARGREVSRAYKELFGEIGDHLGGLKTVK